MARKTSGPVSGGAGAADAGGEADLRAVVAALEACETEEQTLAIIGRLRGRDLRPLARLLREKAAAGLKAAEDLERAPGPAGLLRAMREEGQ